MKYFQNINDFNKYLNIEESKHPLIDIRRFSDIVDSLPSKSDTVKLGFYKIAIKTNFKGFMEYGKTEYDTTKGIMYFLEPDQEFSWEASEPWDGFHFFIHPDIFKKYRLSKNIRSYNFFSYKINEALFLTYEEENTVNILVNEAWNELNSKGDEFSISIIMSYISTLLNITERFYTRQFNTRKIIYN